MPCAHGSEPICAGVQSLMRATSSTAAGDVRRAEAAASRDCSRPHTTVSIELVGGNSNLTEHAGLLASEPATCFPSGGFEVSSGTSKAVDVRAGVGTDLARAFATSLGLRCG